TGCATPHSASPSCRASDSAREGSSPRYGGAPAANESATGRPTDPPARACTAVGFGSSTRAEMLAPRPPPTRPHIARTSPRGGTVFFDRADLPLSSTRPSPVQPPPLASAQRQLGRRRAVESR